MKIKIGKVSHMIVHYVGNKNREEGVSFSERELDYSEVSLDLTTMLSKSFDAKEPYHFFFESSLNLNPIYTFVKTIFEDVTRFQEQSVFIAKILYEKTIHPTSKSGELSIIYLSNCQIDGKQMDAIAMLKTENKQSVIEYVHTESGYEIKKSEVISLSKVEKGCIIFNENCENGYTVFSVDKKAKDIQSKYWKDEFLHIQSDETPHSQTKKLLNSCKSFIRENFSDKPKVEKAELISKIKNTLSQSEYIKVSDFSEEIFGNLGLDREFESYLSSRNNVYSVTGQNIKIEDKIVKLKSSLPKTTLYLDSNFEISIFGDQDKIVQGFDEAAGLNYYKLYYQKEK